MLSKKDVRSRPSRTTPVKRSVLFNSRTGKKPVNEKIPVLDELLSKVTKKNLHLFVNTGAPVGNEEL